MRARTRFALPLLAILLLLALGVTTHAETPKPTAAGAAPASGSSTPELSFTQHSISIKGETLKYTAVAGWLPIEDAAGKRRADIFFVAYHKDGVDPVHRPVAFAFNGGPGASTVFLHLGGLGPKRVPLAEDGTALPGSVQLVDNPATWLTFTDLVFVDPVGTGYSRPAPGVEAKSFFGLDEDVRVTAAFVQRYVSHFGRWRSPKYLIGESYGTTRVARLARRLQDRDGIYVDGLVLISSALDFQTFSSNNDLAYVLSLPTYTATAQYHGQGLPMAKNESLETKLGEVERWAVDDYLPALAKGSSLPGPQRSQLDDRLATLTGLPQADIARHEQRIGRSFFRKELLRKQGRVIGMLDGRVMVPGLAPSLEDEQPDPAFFVVIGPYVAAMNAYLRDDLGVKSDKPYQFFSREANQAWDWGSALRGYVNVTASLREAMAADPRLRVLMAAGYYDLTTPYSSQKYTAEHLRLPSSLETNVVFRVYHSGHQIYTSLPALEEFTRNAAQFVTSRPSAHP